MRFFRLPLLALAAVATTVSAGKFQFQFTADNSFQVFVSPKSHPDVASIRYLENFGTKQQDEWTSPTTFENEVELFEGDVVSVYMHNIIDVMVTDPTQNPSAIVGRLVQLDSVQDPVTFVTNEKWLCAWRHEFSDNPNEPVTKFDPTRYDMSYKWAAKSFDAAFTPVPLLAGQTGSNTFKAAVSLGQLGGNNFWHSQGYDKNVITAMGGANPGPTWADPAARPTWIYGYDAHTMPIGGEILAHHGWCRFTVPHIPGDGSVRGDPQFSGFQGQSFQFHGLPDEHFNLISSPSVQLNAHFVYIAAGTCDYTETPCWSHPGTYMDVLGFTIAETHVKIAAGPHHAGLRVWNNGTEIVRGDSLSLSNYTDATLTYTRDGRVKIETEAITYQIVNSDSFLNFDATLNDPTLLAAGRPHHTITDQTLCKENYADSGDYRTVEKMVSEKYHITTPMHGLVGQSWRNIKVCGKDWMGTVEDYLVSSLFASDYHYNYFNF